MMGRRSARGEGRHGLRVLEGARVLVTRSPDRAGALLAALRETGAEPLLLPLIDFERARDLHSLEVAFDALGAGAYTWLVISSVTTVQALEELARERGSTLSRWLPGSLQVATIGPATRRELELRGITVDLAPARLQSGVGLLDIWPQGQGSVFLPQADIADARLAEGLESLGARVQAVTAYHTVDYPADPARSFTPSVGNDASAAPPGTGVLTPAEAKAELDAGRLHAVVAASPSAARRIHAGLSPLGECRFVAIGRSTAAEAESLGLPVAAVAEEPTTSGLVSAVIEALAPGHATPPPATETYVKDRT
ncbi:uroporphyrinogen-III synthase [Arthrobacter sp. PvP102]|uniref:uroporphyrinogen-III synthase n=1 Tax=unclassified Arthrobacter TaxID=235627 RepID=UPI0000527392|nr:uroporphyrinogen-III synthase [Arthrobacter sp. PvP102]ABK04145.1 uroporphyrinogen-III synthase [Arthrobacter sp. FB24]MBP1237209.1 uroporphyrinogen-III synthase [Arthrobacter sp. PvP102]